MIAYLDTSALVKLYVQEDGSSRVERLVADATVVATARVAYVEARAAFARHRRDGALTAPALRRVIQLLDTDWGCYTIVEVSEPLVRQAGALAERRALRAYDALHLAGALEIAGGTTETVFACFDERLTLAARREGLAALA